MLLQEQRSITTDGSDPLRDVLATSMGVYVVGYGSNIVSGTSGADWWIKMFSN